MSNLYKCFIQVNNVKYPCESFYSIREVPLIMISSQDLCALFFNWYYTILTFRKFFYDVFWCWLLIIHPVISIEDIFYFITNFIFLVFTYWWVCNLLLLLLYGHYPQELRTKIVRAILYFIMFNFTNLIVKFL